MVIRKARVLGEKRLLGWLSTAKRLLPMDKPANLLVRWKLAGRLSSSQGFSASADTIGICPSSSVWFRAAGLNPIVRGFESLLGHLKEVSSAYTPALADDGYVRRLLEEV